MKVRGNQKGLELNWTYQFLDYSDDVNILGENMYTLNKNPLAHLDASREDGLEVNAEKINYPIFVSPSKCRTKSQYTDR
jgi:hypothetical protein